MMVLPTGFWDDPEITRRLGRLRTAITSCTPELADLMEHEKVIEQGLAGFIEVGNALLAIKDGKKYRHAGFATFEDYCQQRWQIGGAYSYRLIAAATTVEALAGSLLEAESGDVKDLSPMGDIPLPRDERQVRPLTTLPPDLRAEAWKEAVDEAGGDQPTAAQVEVAVQKRKPMTVPKPPPKVNGVPVPSAPPHPAVYGDAILAAFRELLDEHFDVPGGLICDPFAGTGRIHELQADGWETVGVELEPEWAGLHPDTICGDSRNLANLLYDRIEAETVRVIATSPAYGNRLADGHYDASDPQARRTYALDLGRPLTPGSGAGLQWGSDYKALHEAVWHQAEAILEEGGLFLLNAKNHVRGGVVQQVVAWHIRTLTDLGLRVIDAREIAPSGLALTTAAKLPEHVIVFRKPVER